MSDWLWFALTSAAFVLLGKPQQPRQQQQQQQQQQHNAVASSSVWNGNGNKDWVWSVSSKTNRPHWWWPIHRSAVVLHQSNNNNNSNNNRLWHRATYLIIHHVPTDTILLWNSTTATSSSSEATTTMLQLPNDMVGYGESYSRAAQRIQKSVATTTTTTSTTTTTIPLLEHTNAPVQRLFGFRFSPGNEEGINVWGELYQAQWNESLNDYQQQQQQTISMSFGEMVESLQNHPDRWTLDARHVLGLYQQHRQVTSSSSSSTTTTRVLPKAVFFDCDDCLYFDGWVIADELTQRIEDWCVSRHGLAKGEAYRLYKKHGTCLRGLLAEGYMRRDDETIHEFLEYVHDLGIPDKLQPDPELRRVLLSMNPSVPKYVFTASVRHHAERVLKALGIEDLLLVDDIVDVWVCGMETKHSPASFRAAMRVAGIDSPSSCVLLDDSVRNLQAGNHMGWRCVLVGRVGRDCGKPVTAKPDSEAEIDRIHDLPQALPELFMW